MSIQSIREDIKSLRGTTVNIFGQPTTLSNEVEKGVIDILDVLDVLEEYEMPNLIIERYNQDIDDYVEEKFGSVEDLVEFMENELGDWKEIEHGNSYNWSSIISNNFDFRILKDFNSGYVYVQFMVHRFGDVRANYTEYALLEFRNVEEFFEVLMEANHYIELDDEHYAYLDIFSDGYEIYEKDGNYVKTVYDLDDWGK